jgi:putative Holliday junction resolvase
MAIRNMAELGGELPERAALIGLDLGSKTIGVALSDARRTIASPRETIKRTKFTADAKILETLYTAEQAAAFVLGLPVNMDGSEGPACQSARQFAANLEARFECTLAFWDERLSTVAVTRSMIEADLSRKKRAERVDAAAAAYILQGALDYLKGRG